MIVNWRHPVNDRDLCCSLKSQKSHRNLYFGVQGHSWSLNLAQIESQLRLPISD